MSRRSSGASDSSTATRETIMQPKAGQRVVGRDGLKGRIERVTNGGRVLVRFRGGRLAALPTESLIPKPDGKSYSVNLGASELDQAREQGSADGMQDDEITIPVIEEQVRVNRQPVETGRVTLRRMVHEEEQDVQADLRRDHVEVERVPIDQPVANPSDPPQTREVDGELVIPVCEEVLVVEKQLMLREEVHVRRSTSTERQTEKVPVRREELKVHREPTATGSASEQPADHRST